MNNPRRSPRLFFQYPLLLAIGLVLLANLARAEAPKIIADGPPLPGTERLELSGDISSQLVDGADRFLKEQAAKSVERRAAFWKRDFTSAEKYNASIEPNRQRLAQILGLRDARAKFDAFELQATTAAPALIGEGLHFQAFAVRWPAFADVHGVGLLLIPAGDKRADVIALPDADQTPEMLVGLADGIPRPSQFARQLAESGCRVLVPLLIDREQIAERVAKMTRREFIYRSAFELGRHIQGYELQKVLAAVDYFAHDAGSDVSRIGVIGYGEGGLLALNAAALDPRIKAACVSGYFGPREAVWQEPLDRNVWGLLEQFGDAELAAMIAPRSLIVEASQAPQFTFPPGLGGAPGRLITPNLDDVRRELTRAEKLIEELRPAAKLELIASGNGDGPFGTTAALSALLAALSPDAKLLAEDKQTAAGVGDVKPLGPKRDLLARQQSQFAELSRHNQQILAGCAETRKKYFARLDTSSLEKFQATIEPYRKQFYDDAIGRFDLPLLPPQARTRKTYDEPKWTGYEVVLDVFPDLIAYGLLLVPKDLRPDEKRPVVVCQHGLEGRPQDVIAGGNKLYAEFASTLAERGFVTFAPQNLYLFKDRFRALQRQANPLRTSLFSLIVPQHQQIVDWLATLPFVDPQRIAFYGLSYGGKSAMRIPPLVKNYCLSICSGDFNEWVWKNASIDNKYTYVGTGEYEIFEFDLGSTFNYAEMAALIAPRPFMVERGHFDGVGSDEMVAYEFAKVRFLYEAKLGLGDRCLLAWFNGPHMIHGQESYPFLHKHLHWPEPAAEK